jgi:TRAP-type C4-dicarboxylate transport system permease small subunit
MKRLAETLHRIPIIIGTALMLCICIVVSANVVARYVFNYGLIWSDEIARFSLIWITFLGTAVLVRQGQHIAIDVFESKMSAGMKRFSYYLTQIIVMAVAIILIWQGTIQVGRQFGQISPGIQVRVGLVYTVIPLTGYYLLAYSIINILGYRKK